jgi:hypothetical protein
MGHSLFAGTNRRLWHISDRIIADNSDDSDEEPDAGPTAPLTIRTERRDKQRPKPGRHGIELRPCKHVFCGVSISYQDPGIAV